MADGGKNRGKIAFSSADGESSGYLRRFVVSSVLILLIVMIAFGVMVGTEAGKGMIESYLTKIFGMKMEIQKARIGFPYELVIEDITSPDFESLEKPGIKIQDIRCGFGKRSFLNIHLNRCSLNLIQDTDGHWMPGVFARLGDLPVGNIADVSRLTSGFRNWWSVSVDDGTILWNSNVGTKASARGITFSVLPVDMPRNKMYFHALSVYDVVGVDGAKAHDIEIEWLAAIDDEFIELSRSEFSLPSKADNFWEVGSRKQTNMKETINDKF